MKEKKLAEEGNARKKNIRAAVGAALISLFQCFDEELGDEVGRTVDVL